jgi:chromosome segregation ATPase
VSEIQGGVSEDPGRIIYELEERLRVANNTIVSQAAEIEQLRAEWQTEFYAAKQLRSDNDWLKAEIERLQTELQQSEIGKIADAETAEYAARLEGLLDNSRETLRDLQDDHTAMGHHCEGMKSAFLAVIKTLWEIRR